MEKFKFEAGMKVEFRGIYETAMACPTPQKIEFRGIETGNLITTTDSLFDGDLCSTITEACDIMKVFNQHDELIWSRYEGAVHPLHAIDVFADDIHKISIQHGYWKDNISFPHIVALCHSELSQALNEFQEDNEELYYYDNDGDISTDFDRYDDGMKLGGIAAELADCMLIIFDWFAANGIDVSMVLGGKKAFYCLNCPKETRF